MTKPQGISVDAMEDRVRRLEVWKDQAEARFAQLTIDLRTNTEMTASVKQDTAQLVELFIASKVNLRMMRWVAAFLAACSTIWVAVYAGLRGH